MTRPVSRTLFRTVGLALVVATLGAGLLGSRTAHAQGGGWRKH